MNKIIVTELKKQYERYTVGKSVEAECRVAVGRRGK